MNSGANQSPEGLVRPGPMKELSHRKDRLPDETDKTRAAWFQARAEAAAEEQIENLIAERQRLATDRTLDWDFVGPSNIGGRATALAAHPEQAGLVYLGTAGGGVWRSHDHGQRWQALWRFEDVLSIGSLAIDPRNPQVLYAGSGEANLSGDNYPGIGLYRSANAGDTWELLASCRETRIPRRIGTIAVNPLDSNHVVLGGVSQTGESPGGLFTSRDGGRTWAREAFGGADYRCHSIVFSPEGNTIYAGVDATGLRSGIWRSDDNGASWTQLSEGLPPGDALGRTSLAISPSNPAHLYALISDRTSGVLGVFRTINGGEIWSAIGWSYFAREKQMSYNNCIAVHPTNPNLVICGGMDLHRTTDGGKTWTQATEWTADRGNGGYAHADHHALMFALTEPDSVYDGNDGGMDFSSDAGIRWENRSNTLGATMFYAIDVAQSNGNCFGGGSQDNGSVITDNGRADGFFQALGGDGGWIVYDPTDPTHMYACYQRMNIHRHRTPDGWVNVTPEEASAAERATIWQAEIAMDPFCPTTVFTASQRIWRTRNDGDSWTAVSPVLDGGAVTALELCIANARVIYAGTEKGGIFRSVDGGNSWTQNMGTAPLPPRVITCIEAHPENSEIVFLTVGGVSQSNPFPHVYRSDDGGRTWKDADHGGLPNVPHHALAFFRETPLALFVASDAGVYRSDDLAETWQNVSGNLPHVVVTDLVYHRNDRTLTAGTYGRGMWRLRFE